VSSGAGIADSERFRRRRRVDGPRAGQKRSEIPALSAARWYLPYFQSAIPPNRAIVCRFSSASFQKVKWFSAPTRSATWGVPSGIDARTPKWIA